MKTIKDIQTKIYIADKLSFVVLLLLVICFISFILSAILSDISYISQAAGISATLSVLSLILAFIIIMIAPLFSLNLHERFRYSAYLLNDSLNKRETEEAIFNLNKFAKDTVILTKEMKKLPLQKDNVNILEKVVMVLKYKVYSDLLKGNTDDCAFIVKDMQQAIEEDDISRLSNLVQNYSFENKDENILLPYEKLSIYKKYYTTFLNFIINYLYKYFVLRLMTFITILSIFGYLITEAIPSIEFDSTLFSTIIVVAFGLSSQYMIKNQDLEK